MYWLCVNVNYHRVTTQMQLINIIIMIPYESVQLHKLFCNYDKRNYPFLLATSIFSQFHADLYVSIRNSTVPFFCHFLQWLILVFYTVQFHGSNTVSTES
jgi:hypothetical protein